MTTQPTTRDRQVTDATAYRDMRIGDRMPNGNYIVAADLTVAALEPGKFLVTLITCHFVKPEDGTFVAASKEDPDSVPRIQVWTPMWADETYGQSADRADFYAGLPN